MSASRDQLSRRSLLGLGLGTAASLGLPSTLLGALLPRAAFALGDANRVDLAELTLSSGTLSRSAAWVRLLYEVIQTTSVEAFPRTVILEPGDPRLFEHPLAVMVGNDALPPLADEAIAQLARYVQYGGFLLLDDASGVADSAFDTSVRRLCSRLFPTRPLAPLPSDHSLYRAFFLIERPLGRLDLLPYLEGITVGEVTPIVYCRNDLSGALDRGPDGRNAHHVSPGGERQRREAVKLGINLVLYALTSNYKHDMTHVRQLMQDGRIE